MICTVAFSSFANLVYAGPSLDDMEFLFEYSSIETQVPKVEPEPVRRLDLLEVKLPQQKNSFSGSGGDLNVPLLIGGGVAGVAFIAILYFYYMKIERLSEKVEVSKNMVEKYFYNMQENYEEFEKVEKRIEANVGRMNQIKEQLQGQIESQNHKLNG